MKKGGDVDPSVISDADLTNKEEGETGRQCYTRYQDLLKDFVALRDILRSDGPDRMNGHINSRDGVLLDEIDLLSELRLREDDREAERVAREDRERERGARCAQRATESARRVADKELTERLKEQNRLWNLNIQQRCNSLASTRATLRAAARLRSGKTVLDNKVRCLKN